MSAKRVLIIDDEPGIRQIVQIALKAIASWDVFMAASGSEGLELAESEQPDVILLDVMMPGMDGLTTLRHIRENVAIQNIPTILLTAKAQSSEQQRFRELAIAGVITKPFKAQELVDQMRSLLNWTN
jgi:DNA-binding response OmpR family regulator